MGAALKIRTDPTSRAQLQRLARQERSPRTAPRLLAIASALEGESQTEAARLAPLFCGPDPVQDSSVDWTLPALCGWLEGRFGKRRYDETYARMCLDMRHSG